LKADRAVVVQAQSGAALRVELDGEIAWRVGSAGEELSRLVSPTLSRDVLFLAGETVRAIDPKSGHILAEVRAGATLIDLAADAKLNLYLLDEEGTLTAHRLATHLAVVSGLGS